MALTYDYTDIDTGSWSKDDHSVAKQFCWTLMFIDQTKVTEENKTEILFRIEFLQELGMGPWTHRQTVSDIRKTIKKLIGYKTNVGEKSTAKFMSRWMKTYKTKILDRMNKKLQASK